MTETPAQALKGRGTRRHCSESSGTREDIPARRDGTLGSGAPWIE